MNKTDSTEKPFYKTESFKKLDAKWQKKLADSGFRDIEYRVDGEPANYMVGPNPEYFIRRYTPDKEQYYNMATTWAYHLREQMAAREVHRVWDLHAQGNSYNDIVKALGYGRNVVSRIVNNQKKLMLEAVRQALPPFNTDVDFGDPSHEESDDPDPTF
jgi:hypothetical protein